MTEILLKLNERHHLRCFSPFNQNYQTRFRRNWLHKLLLTSSRISFSSACASASSFSLCFVKVCNFRASSFWTALVPIGGLDRIFAFSAFRKKYSEPQYVFCWTLINFVPKKKKKNSPWSWGALRASPRMRVPVRRVGSVQKLQVQFHQQYWICIAWLYPRSPTGIPN